jgi:glycosyltransferase involved in cell wall biosynthesis
MSDDVIKLARPGDLGQKPSLALHLLVKNGASVVGRLIDCVGPYIQEVVAVLNDCDDRTYEEIIAASRRHDVATSFVSVRSTSHPELYIPDVPATYQNGRSLVGERYEGPFTGRPILADWAAARNKGWQQDDSHFRIMLDADDVVDDPQCLPGLCQLMDERGLDVLASRYHYSHVEGGASRADAFRERIARNRPEIIWKGRVHECLSGYDPARVAHVEGNLIVHDRRDSMGAGIRIPGRNLKILYYWARRQDWEITPREMIYLAAESRVAMPRLAAKLLEMYLEASSWGEEMAWAASMMGEILENEAQYQLAATWYEQSLEYHPGVLSAMRLCRAMFRQERWAEAVAAYERGLANKTVPQLLDGGNAHEDATKILVATALRRLGRYEESRSLCAEARAKFPRSAALSELSAKLDADARKAGVTGSGATGSGATGSGGSDAI